jgi:hypothetical protein
MSFVGVTVEPLEVVLPEVSVDMIAGSMVRLDNELLKNDEER